jgi:DNA polymerase alpha subunit A
MAHASAVLKEILSGEATEIVVSNIHDLLTALGERVRSGSVPLDDFIIFKRLGKNPEDYPDKKSQPHVQVALRMRSKGTAVRAHDVIPYIMCVGEDGKSARTAQADKAFHPDDLRRQGSELKIGESTSTGGAGTVLIGRL